MKSVLKFLLHRITLRVLGFVALSLLIWFVGPLIAIGSVRPLEPVWVRALFIVSLLLYFVIRIVITLTLARRKEEKLVEDIAQPTRFAEQDMGSAAEIATLQQRFEQALRLLKQARPAGKRKFMQRLAALSPSHYLYQLPWYLIIGAPGTGKTTVLVNSGLHFPLADELGTNAIQGVGGTRNCDWWFTDEAVLLDTAGRYTTPESDSQTDSEAWRGFLQLLKKHRPRQPFNGVLLTVSVTDLLTETPAQLAEHATNLRRRLRELQDVLKFRFPVYLLLTKADMLDGFVEFFSNATDEERTQVWGFTFPTSTDDSSAETLIGSTAVTGYARWRGEFEQLLERINARLIDRLQQERDLGRRAAAYVFPQRFASLATPLGTLLDRVFGSSRFDGKTLLRGIYFTSGVQSTPVPVAPSETSDELLGHVDQLAPLSDSGNKSFFVKRLLREVVFAEAGLAGFNKPFERRRLFLRAAAFTLVALAAVGSAIAWSISYKNNSSYIAQVDSQVQRLAEDIEQLDLRPSTDLASLLPVLNTLSGLAASADSDAAAPWKMSFGLYQGRKLGSAAELVYRRLLQDVFLTRLALRMEQLVADSTSNPDLRYEGLKAYLMLHDAKHFDAASLTAFITADWDVSLPRNVSQEQRRELDEHLKTLFSNETVSVSMPLNHNLVERTRAQLLRSSTAQRIYGRLKRQGLGSNIPEFTIARAAGPSGSIVFTRESGAPLSQGVPGLFSFDAYHKVFVQEAQRVSRQLESEESWVLGVAAQDLKTQANALAGNDTVFEQVRRMYLEDYAAAWEAFVKDVRVIRSSNLQQSIQVAQILSAPDSPLPQLMRAIVKEVTLVPNNTDKGLSDKVSDTLKNRRDELVKLFGMNAPSLPTGVAAQPELIVDARFEGLRRLVSGKPAPIDSVNGLMSELYTHLVAVDDAQRRNVTPPPSEVAVKIKAEAARLPEPVRSTMTDLSSLAMKGIQGQNRGLLNTKLQAQVTDFCNKALNGRYPFVRNSERDVTQDDFARLFAGAGVMDEFVQKELLPYVDTTNSPWLFRKSGENSGGDGSAGLRQFERAQLIRDVFFRNGGRTPSLRLELKPLEMDAAITQFNLDVDGQLFRYSHGPQIPTRIQWPGPKGLGQVRLSIAPALANRSATQSFDGPWALFRLFDKARVEPTAQPERFKATFDIDGRKIVFEITTNSVQNPFRLRELEQFECPSRL